ncbi:MAG: prepilin-type N-terminal cleavage/methylation domain-containing protein [Opitutae bacterium]|nr:prepilin-type N-terminal cleavage/methylation domain-containing protein [Opitutae bacterium]
MRRRTSSPFDQRGFTLLEILLATVVGAMVLVVIQGVFFGALRLRNTTSDRMASDLVLQRTLRLVERDLSGLMLPGGTLSGELQSVPDSSLTSEVAGERIGPDFYTNSGQVDGRTPYADVQMVTYYLAPAADGAAGKSLVRSVTRNLLPTLDTTVTEERILMSGIADAAFEYFDGLGWTDVWDSAETQTLPSAIKFRLLLATNDTNGVTPEPIVIVVPIVVTTTTSQTLALEDIAP